MWPQTIKNIFLIVTCSITIIGTKESAVAQYLCCNPNWHSLERFGSKTRHRPEPRTAHLGGRELLPLETSSRGDVPWVPLLRCEPGVFPAGEVSAQSLAAKSSGWGMQRWRFGSGCEDSCFARLGSCGKTLLLLGGLLTGIGSGFVSFYSWCLGGLFVRRCCLEETLLMHLFSSDGWK